MEAYTDFAEVYDTFMDNVPYEKWADYIADRLGRAGIRDGLVLELGCGTGTLTQLLARRGYDMIGVERCGRRSASATASITCWERSSCGKPSVW